MPVKVRDLLETIDERQRRNILSCVERCGIPDLEKEVEIEIDDKTLSFLKALANPIRFSILKLLRDNWLCVCLISRALNQDQTLVSHHLRTLRSLDLIEERKEGRMHFYRARRVVIEDYLERVRRELLGE